MWITDLRVVPSFVKIECRYANHCIMTASHQRPRSPFSSGSDKLPAVLWQTWRCFSAKQKFPWRKLLVLLISWHFLVCNCCSFPESAEPRRMLFPKLRDWGDIDSGCELCVRPARIMWNSVQHMLRMWRQWIRGRASLSDHPSTAWQLLRSLKSPCGYWWSWQWEDTDCQTL